ncbi:MAG: class I SAM-dependent methyltransferase [Acidobacteriota bacterium]
MSREYHGEELPREKNILDFGAGIGFFAEQMRDRGFSVACFEPDPALAGHLAGLGFVCISSLKTVGGNRFDRAYLFNVLEHIENDNGALKQIHAVLAPGESQ